MFMLEALKEARSAGEQGNLPIGSVIVHNGTIIAKGRNQRHTNKNNLAHAEINAINQCIPYLNEFSRECILYTTVEPCIMCLSTIVMANIRHVVFAVKDKYMNIDQMIEAMPYMKERLYTYEPDVLKEESISLLEKYSPAMASMILTGKRN